MHVLTVLGKLAEQLTNHNRHERGETGRGFVFDFFVGSVLVFVGFRMIFDLPYINQYVDANTLLIDDVPCFPLPTAIYRHPPPTSTYLSTSPFHHLQMNVALATVVQRLPELESLLVDLQQHVERQHRHTIAAMEMAAAAAAGGSNPLRGAFEPSPWRLDQPSAARAAGVGPLRWYRAGV
jgi:hypothetical protein